MVHITASLFAIDVLDLLEYKPIICKGYTCMIHIHTYANEITIKGIIWSQQKEPGTGNWVKKDKPKYAQKGTASGFSHNESRYFLEIGGNQL